MVSYRPLGVTVLAVFIIITYSIIFLLGIALLIWGIKAMPVIGIKSLGGSFLGIVFIIWAFLRISTGFGLLGLRKPAWRSAMTIFCIGLVIDFFIAREQVILDAIIIIYLIIVKRHFRYGY